jgi:transcriptional regulatory protein LevR
VKEEAGRRKAFIKRAHELIAACPGYARPLPAPTNETDKFMQEKLEFSQAMLGAVWADCRAGTGTAEQFEAALTRWWVDRLHAIEIMTIKVQKIKKEKK